MLYAFSGRLVTFTIGLRFLTDFLQGYMCFRVHRPQFRLIESVAKQEDAMRKFADRSQ